MLLGEAKKKKRLVQFTGDNLKKSGMYNVLL